MSTPDSSATSSPGASASTPPSSIPPSPEIQALSLSDTAKEVTEEDKAEALKIKAQANKAFIGMRISKHDQRHVNGSQPINLPYAAHDFPEAAKLYSFAIEKNPTDATIWCNRAAARIKIEEHGYALSDACMSAVST